MKDFNVRNVVETYYKIAALKDKTCSEIVGAPEEIVARHVFGAQQLAWLLWSECKMKLDIFHAVSLLAFHKIRKVAVPTFMTELKAEFKAATTKEAKFARLCDFLEQRIRVVGFDDVGELLMDLAEKFYEIQISYDVLVKVLGKYRMICVLKKKVRQGWNEWHVNVPSREVVAEHIFGTEPLACLMYVEGNEKINIEKVIGMLSLHETEEVLLPDYTPHDGMPADVWAKLSEEAIKAVLGDLCSGDFMISLIKEFDKKETAEGKFAYLCDKMECNLQIKKYSDAGACTIDGGSTKVKKDALVQSIIANGAETVSEVFLIHEMSKYTGTNFEKVAKFLRVYDTNQ